MKTPKTWLCRKGWHRLRGGRYCSRCGRNPLRRIVRMQLRGGVWVTGFARREPQEET